MVPYAYKTAIACVNLQIIFIDNDVWISMQFSLNIILGVIINDKQALA